MDRKERRLVFVTLDSLCWAREQRELALGERGTALIAVLPGNNPVRRSE